MHHRHVTCPSCGREFYQDEPWKKTCLSCWKASRNGGRAAEVDSEELLDLRQRVKFLGLHVNQLYAENIKLKESQSVLPLGMKDHFKSLLFYCHPDRNGGDPKATAIIAWLFNLRREVGASWQ